MWPAITVLMLHMIFPEAQVTSNKVDRKKIRVEILSGNPRNGILFTCILSGKNTSIIFAFRWKAINNFFFSSLSSSFNFFKASTYASLNFGIGTISERPN